MELPILGKWGLACRARPCESRKAMVRRVKLPRKANLRKPTIRRVPTTLSCWAEVWVKRPHQEEASAAGMEEVEEGADSEAALGVKAVVLVTRLAGEAAPEVADLVAVVLAVEVLLAAGHAIAPPRIASEGILQSSTPTQPLMRTLTP